MSIPADRALSPMPFRDDGVTGLDIRKAVLTKASQAKLKLAERVVRTQNSVGFRNQLSSGSGGWAGMRSNRTKLGDNEQYG